MVLAAASFGFSLTDLGRLEMPLAMGIAAVKALLVALVFMQVLRSGVLTQVIVLVAVVLMGTLVALAGADIATREGVRDVPPAVEINAERRPGGTVIRMK